MPMFCEGTIQGPEAAEMPTKNGIIHEWSSSVHSLCFEGIYSDLP